MFHVKHFLHHMFHVKHFLQMKKDMEFSISLFGISLAHTLLDQLAILTGAIRRYLSPVLARMSE